MNVRHGVSVLSLAVVALFAPSASASVIGHLAFSACGSGGVIVNFATIDFFNPILGGNGCILAGVSSITFDGAPGSIAPGEQGTVNDLGFPPPGSGNAGFITFLGVAFNLSTIGPGVSNLACSPGNPNDPACSVFAGSPFILAPTGNNSTTISLSVGGFATDATSTNSPWLGTFTETITGKTPLQIRNTICGPGPGCTGVGGGSVTATSFAFDGIAPLPEPATMLLFGGGLIALAGLKRRKSRP